MSDIETLRNEIETLKGKLSKQEAEIESLQNIIFDVLLVCRKCKKFEKIPSRGTVLSVNGEHYCRYCDLPRMYVAAS